jgi:hypothetical protein
MSVQRLSISILLLVGSVAASLLFLFSSLLKPMYPAVPWHIEGQVFDESTNALADVRLSISGTRKVTGINQNRRLSICT